MSVEDLDLIPQSLEGARALLVVSKGTIATLYPAMVLATTAPAMGMEVDIYFTLWALRALTEDGVESPRIASVGNPGLLLPNIMRMLPGMTKMAKESGVRIYACSPTMGFMGVKQNEMIPEVDDNVGA